MKITEKEVEIAIELYLQAKSMLKVITKDRPISALSEREYSRAEYWEGKIIGMEDIFQTLNIDYRRRK